ncbi:hypothetical protein LTR41_000260 [Exophiala xenobiotica]|nr:hypothetical protein LTR41_000260 [Exophiala xenobiotica]
MDAPFHLGGPEVRANTSKKGPLRTLKSPQVSQQGTRPRIVETMTGEIHYSSTNPGIKNLPHKTLEALTTAPGRPGQAYVLQSSCGETIYIPCSRSATRLLVTGKESDNAFAVVGTAGSHSAPIGFHFHREAHDIFLCLKGQVNVWAGDTQCRTLSQGDFASVPPGVVHQYQILGPYTEFVGLIVPGGWEEFFRFIGEPYDTQGPLYPLTDDRNVFEVLIPKLKAAAEKFDMVPVPDHRGVQPQPWEVDETDNTLPGALEPYFLRAGSGPRYLLGGIVASPLIGTAESNNRFSIGSIEGSSWHEKLTRSPLSETFTFDDVHHAFQVADGSMTFILNGSESATLNVGETIYIPARTSFSMQIKSRYTKIYAFISGAGILNLLCKAGEPYHQPVPPEKAQDWDKACLEALQGELKFRM